MDNNTEFLTSQDSLKLDELRFESLTINQLASTPARPDSLAKKFGKDTSMQSNGSAPSKNWSKRTVRSKNNSYESDSDEDVLPNPSHSYSKRNKRKMRSKKYGRRHHNFCYMLKIVYGSSLTDDEFEFEENDDLVDRESPFSKVILNKDNLRIWVEFVSKSGQEQDDYLDKLDQKEYKKNHGHGGKPFKPNQSEFLDSQESSDSDMDYERNLRFAQYSYSRIDKNIRDAIKKESSMTCLEKYETEVISAFASNPEHCVENIMCKFERLILHGLCQYMDIRSKSIQKGISIEMRLKFNGDKFHKPAILLSDFLKRRILF